MYMKKASQKVETNEILTAGTLLLQLCKKKALVLSQSDARDLFTSIIGLSFPRVSLSPRIKSTYTVKYIQDEHGEKRRKNEHF